MKCMHVGNVDYLDYSGVFDEWFHLELCSSGKVGAVSSPGGGVARTRARARAKARARARRERARSKSIKGESWAILTEYRF